MIQLCLVSTKLESPNPYDLVPILTFSITWHNVIGQCDYVGGEVIPDGTAFRNEAHFRYKADIFVPCGGRPEAINVGNVARMWDAEGKCNVKYIVEVRPTLKQFIHHHLYAIVRIAGRQPIHHSTSASDIGEEG